MNTGFTAIALLVLVAGQPCANQLISTTVPKENGTPAAAEIYLHPLNLVEKTPENNKNGWITTAPYGIHAGNGHRERSTEPVGNNEHAVVQAGMTKQFQTVSAATPSIFVLFLVSLLWMPFNRWKKNVRTPHQRN